MADLKNLRPKRTRRSQRRAILAVLVVFALLAAACSDEATSTPSSTAATSDGESPPSQSETESRSAWEQTNYRLLPIVEVDEPTTAIGKPGSASLWVAERSGILREVDLADVEEVDNPSAPITIQLPDDNNGPGNNEPGESGAAALDISDRVSVGGEGGLLGISFSPDGSKFYASYTNLAGDSVLSEFEVDGDSIAGEERILLEVDQPFSNHNGGAVTFGPDGMLYLGLGDGGSGGDPEGNGQDLTTLLGSILRIDPTAVGDQPYQVPEDNPFTEANSGFVDAEPEIWIYGLRNPWRFSFDSQTGDLWIGDVGQDRFEEINFLPESGEGTGRGANLGWNSFEANQSLSGAPEPENHQRPLVSYETTDDQCSVIGGHVYRGAVLEELNGVYLHGDYCAGTLFGIEQATSEVVASSPLTLDRSVENVIALAAGPAGEAYVLEQGGQISRLAPLDGSAGSVA